MNLTLIDIGSNLTHDSFDGLIARRCMARAFSKPACSAQMVTGADLAGSTRRLPHWRRRNPARPMEHRRNVHPHHAQRVSILRRARRAGRASAACRQVVAGGRMRPRDITTATSPPAKCNVRRLLPSWKRRSAARKPVFLHQRDAHRRFRCDSEGPPPGVWSGVSHIASPAGGSELEDYLALDLHMGVTGWVNDERRGAAVCAQAVPHIPSNRLMVETDAPYLLPRDLLPHAEIAAQ
jgi:TatD DNase family protein